MIVERAEREAMQRRVVDEPRIGGHGATPGDLEVEPAGRGLAHVDRGRQAPRRPGRAMPLADVRDPHQGRLRTV
jgi:hypothetical protein